MPEQELPTQKRIRIEIAQLDRYIAFKRAVTHSDSLSCPRNALAWALLWDWEEICVYAINGVVWARQQYVIIIILCTDGDVSDSVTQEWIDADAAALAEKGAGPERKVYTDNKARRIAQNGGGPYHPSNGTEGLLFADQWCEHCLYELKDDCGIRFGLSACILFNDIVDADYPPQLCHDANGQPCCTAFKGRTLAKRASAERESK